MINILVLFACYLIRVRCKKGSFCTSGCSSGLTVQTAKTSLFQKPNKKKKKNRMYKYAFNSEWT